MRTASSPLKSESRAKVASSLSWSRFTDVMNCTVLVGAFAALIACSSDLDRPPVFDGAPPLNTKDAGAVFDSEAPIDCTTPTNTGCACDEVGTFLDCGTVIIQSGDYVTCSEGKRECLPEGVWGDCIGDLAIAK